MWRDRLNKSYRQPITVMLHLRSLGEVHAGIQTRVAVRLPHERSGGRVPSPIGQPPWTPKVHGKAPAFHCLSKIAERDYLASSNSSITASPNMADPGRRTKSHIGYRPPSKGSEKGPIS
jgi:hypothetical protein